MDIPRKDVRRKKVIRWAVGLTVSVAAVTGITSWLSKLKQAAPSVELSTVWRDTVKRGPMLRDVRGLGTLVPEETMLIPATTEGRVQSILIRPGTPVKADSVVMILTSPELETALLGAEYALKAAEWTPRSRP
jgi:HlyD family secretion protein